MKRITTLEAPAAIGPYNQGATGRDFLFTAGQIALTPEGELINASIEEEVHQVMRNLQAILNEAGCSFSDVVKTTIYITELSIYKTVNIIYGSYFSNNEYPARECVGVAFLPLSDVHVEISMIAALPTPAVS